MHVELELHPDNPLKVVAARYVWRRKSYDHVTYERRFQNGDLPDPSLAVNILLTGVAEAHL